MKNIVTKALFLALLLAVPVVSQPGQTSTKPEHGNSGFILLGAAAFTTVAIAAKAFWNRTCRFKSPGEIDNWQDYSIKRWEKQIDAHVYELRRDNYGITEEAVATHKNSLDEQALRLSQDLFRYCIQARARLEKKEPADASIISKLGSKVRDFLAISW